MMESTPLSRVDSTEAPSVEKERMYLHEKQIAVLSARSEGYARRDELKDLKNEVLREVNSRIDHVDEKSGSITRWAIGTICVAALTLTMAIVGATISIFASFVNRTPNSAPVVSVPVAPVSAPPTSTHRVDIVLTVDSARSR